jgi:protein TonB
MRFWVCLFLAASISAGCSRGQTVDKPLQVGGNVQAPVLVEQVEPKYPRPLFGRPKEGSVLVGLVVDQNGVPERLRVIQSVDKKFDRAALDAVKQYRFKPAMQGATPVAVELNLAVQFRVY